jgi:CoA:oxalate CoA-transferase
MVNPPDSNHDRPAMSSSQQDRSNAQIHAAPAAGPLAGIRVIDLSHVYNGPYATFLMAMAGADVIKVEPPGGEHLRSRGDLGGADLPFAMLNSNKRCVTLNLKDAAGRALLLEMVARADVVVENFAPGVTDRLGIGPAALQAINPRLIYGSSSGYGKSGPYRDYPAMDLVVQAMAGIIATTGHADQPPVKAGAAVCDFSAGVHLYGAVVTALFERERTGVGRVVEVSMQDAIYASLASNLGMLHARGSAAPARTGNRHGGLGVAPYNAYEASDGYVVINAPGDRHFRAILEVIGRPELADDPRFATRGARVANMAAVDATVEGWTRTQSRAEAAAKLLASSVPCAPVRELSEVILDRNMHARGSLQWVDHPELGRVVLPHSPLVFEGAERVPLQPSDRLGAGNKAVLGEWLGHSDAELEEWARDGIV